MKRCLKRTFYFLLFLCVVFGMAYLFRNPLLRAVGNYLICEDSLEKADVIIVLGGGSFDRGNEAAKLYRKGYAPKIVTLGEMISTEFAILNILHTDAELAAIHLQNLDVPVSAIDMVKKGTSTKEEAEAALQYCTQHAVKKAIIVSSKIHLLRTKQVFEPLFKPHNIQLILKGCTNTLYSEEEWWKSEEGMIAMNNEYMKHLYYFIKY